MKSKNILGIISFLTYIALIVFNIYYAIVNGVDLNSASLGLFGGLGVFSVLGIKRAKRQNIQHKKNKINKY